MALDSSFVLNALLKYNYLPLQKKNKDEMPPVFSTDGFTKGIAEEIKNIKRRKHETYGGYDQAEYRATRFNNVPRILSIPHPKPYVNLAFCIHDNWDNLKYIIANKKSLITPKNHEDGRLIIMDYEKSWEESQRDLDMTFGCKFTAHTDITNCFPSVYSHAIPWALIGFDEAKKKKGPKYKNEWFNLLDESQRMVQRNETYGVPIGPATSNIITEIILARVDYKLRKDFSYVRFIDDYTCFCKRYEDAEEFIRKLSIELSAFNLSLNIKKTEISPLPKPIKSNWVIDLINQHPTSKTISYSEAINYLDYAVSIHKQELDGSILKYSINAIKKKLDSKAIFGVIKYILSLAFHYPILVSTLNELFEMVCKIGFFTYENKLLQILNENARNYRSDGMCWTLYYILKYKCSIDSKTAKSIIETKDCLSILLLYKFQKHEKAVIDYVDNFDKDDLYGLDQNWPLIYQLYLDEKISNPYTDDTTFEILKNNEFSFLKGIQDN